MYNFAGNICPLIVISKDWESSYYQSKKEKLERLLTIDWEVDIVLFVWAWQYRSDVFRMKQEDYEKFIVDNIV